MTVEDKIARAAGVPRPIWTMIRMSRRSWWQAEYRDGKVVSEWDTLQGKVLLPIGKGSTSRWEELDKKSLVGLRLLCPNGIAGELRTQAWPFFQLKMGERRMGGPADIRMTCDAHVIGLIDNVQGDALCYAWETKERRLFQFRDNVHDFRYRGPWGKLNLAVQGISEH